IGRGDMAGARRAAGVALAVGGGVMTLSAALFALAPRFLAGLYTNDLAVVAVGAALLPIAALFQVFAGVQVVSTGILRGSADTTLPAAVALVGFWLIGLPGASLLAFRAGLGPQGLWLGLTLGLAAVAVLLLLRIRWRFRTIISRVTG
ncbi:MAG TPA: MATE family efflux transporter, partial [Thermoanaerobaculia bacterium]